MEQTTLQMFTATIKYSGGVIFIKPFCDFFQINYDNQCRKIKKSELLKKATGKNTDVSLFGDHFERLTLTKQGFITWILQINPSIVQVNLQSKLIQYQSLIFDYMFGSIEREQRAKSSYARLSKLKRLKAKIQNEISICEQEISNFLDNRFVQTQINFKPNHQLN